MKKLTTIFASIGALAFASSASAGEVSANANPGTVRVNGDVQIDGDGMFQLEVTVDGNIIFTRTIPVASDGTSHSEFDPGILSYDVSSSAGMLDFTLRLLPGAARDSTLSVAVAVVDSVTLQTGSILLDSPGMASSSFR